MLIQNIAWLYYAVHCLLVNVNFMFNILKYTIVLHIYIYVLVIGGYMVFIRNTLFVFFCNYYLNSFIYKYCFKFYFIGKYNAVYQYLGHYEIFNNFSEFVTGNNTSNTGVSV